MVGRRREERRGVERGEGGERGKEKQRRWGEKKGGKKISVFLSDVLGFQLLQG